MAWYYSLTFDPQGAFLHMCSVSLVQKEGERALNLFLTQGFAPLCPCLGYCHDYYLNVFTEEKHWLFALFLLSFPFWRAKRRLILNALTGAHLFRLRKC